LRQIKFAGFTIRIPHHPLLRAALGVILVIGGLLGFLPVLGFWMIPLGLIILSIDFQAVRRFRRVATVKFGKWLLQRWPSLARRAGFRRATRIYD
jgi:purine-cytosine permease-like protein